jgi:hypothetical protein
MHVLVPDYWPKDLIAEFERHRNPLSHLSFLTVAGMLMAYWRVGTTADAQTMEEEQHMLRTGVSNILARKNIHDIQKVLAAEATRLEGTWVAYLEDLHPNKLPDLCRDRELLECILLLLEETVEASFRSLTEKLDSMVAAYGTPGLPADKVPAVIKYSSLGLPPVFQPWWRATL